MRQIITVERSRSSLSSYLIWQDAAGVLGGIAGISEIQLEHQDSNRATISYEWEGPDEHSNGVDATLMLQGMRRIR